MWSFQTELSETKDSLKTNPNQEYLSVYYDKLSLYFNIVSDLGNDEVLIHITLLFDILTYI